jgi:hypothetical protein
MPVSQRSLEEICHVHFMNQLPKHPSLYFVFLVLTSYCRVSYVIMVLLISTWMTYDAPQSDPIQQPLQQLCAPTHSFLSFPQYLRYDQAMLEDNDADDLITKLSASLPLNPILQVVLCGIITRTVHKACCKIASNVMMILNRHAHKVVSEMV